MCITADIIVFIIMIAGGIVFIGGITMVLLLLAFYNPDST